MSMMKLIANSKEATQRIKDGESMVTVCKDYGVELPPDVLKAVQELGEVDFLRFASGEFIDSLMIAMRMAIGMQQRCGNCERTDGVCDACQQDGGTILALTEQVTLLSLMGDIATSEGGRVHDERKAQTLKAEGKLN